MNLVKSAEGDERLRRKRGSPALVSRHLDAVPHATLTNVRHPHVGLDRPSKRVVIICISSYTPSHLRQTEKNNSSVMPQTRGAIVSELQHASDVGVAILAKGGSAADAIIATILVIGTTCSYHSGIGGGGFAIIRTAHGYESLDFRHSAPGAATADFYARLDANKTAIGGLSVAVPGELRGLEEIHRRFGRLSWRTLVEPSIRLARDGFPFTHDCLTVPIRAWR